LLLADFVLFLHLLWCLWILLGWNVSRGRPLLRWLHIGSLIWAVAAELVPVDICPLTLGEDWLESRAGLGSSHPPFLLRLLDALVYPNLPYSLAVAGAVAVCSVILAVYVLRFLRRQPGHTW